MIDKSVVAWPRGLRMGGRGDAASPGLTGDVRTFSGSRLRRGHGPVRAPAFDGPERRAAVREAAPVHGIGKAR